LQKEYAILKTPVKIGDYDRVESYAQSLTKGEEQLLITRNCKFYLTDGKGGYLEFKTINSGITLDEVTQKIYDLNTNLSSDIADLESVVTNLGLKFDKYITQSEFEQLSASVSELDTNINEKINQIDTKISQIDTEIRDIMTSIEEFIITDAEADAAITQIWNEVSIEWLK